MPRPITLKIILKVLKNQDFFFVSQRGSHAKYRKIENNITRTVVLKMSKKEIPHGTFRSIMLLSGINENDFRKRK